MYSSLTISPNAACLPPEHPAMSRQLAFAAVSLLALLAAVPAQERISPDGIEAAVLYAGLDVPEADVKRFAEQAGDKARIIKLTDGVIDEGVPGVRVTVGEANEDRVKALTESG